MNLDLTALAPVILVAFLTLLGNIIYFEHRFKREGTKKLLRQKLTDLIMPLYFVLKRDELAELEWSKNENVDMYDFISGMSERLVEPVYGILKENMYLADDELYRECLDFMEWGFGADVNARFDRLHKGGLDEDLIFKRFRALIYSKFESARRDYLNS
jgi:hypothetical protein